MSAEVQHLLDRLADDIGRSVVINDPAVVMLYSSRHFGDEDPVRVEAMLNRVAGSAAIAHVLAQDVGRWTRPGRIPAKPAIGMRARRARASRLRSGRETDLGRPLPPLPFPSILRIERHRPLRLFDLRGRDSTCPPHARRDQAKRAPHASRLARTRRLADRNHRKLGEPNAAEPVTIIS